MPKTKSKVAALVAGLMLVSTGAQAEKMNTTQRATKGLTGVLEVLGGVGAAWQMVWKNGWHDGCDYTPLSKEDNDKAVGALDAPDATKYQGAQLYRKNDSKCPLPNVVRRGLWGASGLAVAAMAGLDGANKTVEAVTGQDNDSESSANDA